MSVSLITEAHNEVRRLLISGSELAVGDFRLKRLLPQMRKVGESAPIFAQVADIMEKVIEPGSEKVSDRLLELANIVSAVIYTQGQTGFEGTLEGIEPVELRFTTTIPYRRLKPIIEALTAAGSGRLGMIREAYADGVFEDLRLINPLIHALDDNYPDEAELASSILEGFGPSIIPILKDQFNFKGGKGYARRIDIISKLAGRNEKEFFLRAIEKGAREVKVSAARALKDFPDPELEPLFLKLSKDRNKEVRKASLLPLALLSSEASIKRLSDVLNSKEGHYVVYPIKTSNSENITRKLLDEAERTLELILQSEKMFSLSPQKTEAMSEELVKKFTIILDCMEGKKDPKIFEFLNRCLEHSKHLHQFEIDRSYSSEAEYTLAQMVARDLLAFETNEAFELLDSVQGKYDNCLLSYSFEAAVRFKVPEYVFNHYAPYAENGRESYEGSEILGVLDSYIDFEKNTKLIDNCVIGAVDAFSSRPGRENIKWDPRWFELLIDLDETELVCRLAAGYNTKYIEYLLKNLKSNKDWIVPSLNDIVLRLMQAHYPEIMEVINQILDSYSKVDGYLQSRFFNDFARVLRLLPSKYGPVLENYASFYNSKKLFEIAHYIKEKTD